MEMELVPQDRSIPSSRFPIEHEKALSFNSSIPGGEVAVRDATGDHQSVQFSACTFERFLPQFRQLRVHERDRLLPTSSNLFHQRVARFLRPVDPPQSAQKSLVQATKLHRPQATRPGRLKKEEPMCPFTRVQYLWNVRADGGEIP